MKTYIIQVVVMIPLFQTRSQRKKNSTFLYRVSANSKRKQFASEAAQVLVLHPNGDPQIASSNQASHWGKAIQVSSVSSNKTKQRNRKLLPISKRLSIDCILCGVLVRCLFLL